MHFYILYCFSEKDILCILYNVFINLNVVCIFLFYKINVVLQTRFLGSFLSLELVRFHLLFSLLAFRCFEFKLSRGKICSLILELTQQWVHERKVLKHVSWIMKSLRKQYLMKQRTIWINFHMKCFAIFLGKILFGWLLPPPP